MKCSFQGEYPGPLNPNEPLYQSSPFLIEHNPTPSGAFAGKPYAYGVLIDNTSQTFINLRQGESTFQYNHQIKSSGTEARNQMRMKPWLAVLNAFPLTLSYIIVN